MIKSVNNQDFKIIAVSNRKLCNRPFLEQIEKSLQDTSGSCDLKRKRSDRRGIWDIGKRSNEYLPPLSGVLYSS